jgi:hypothetical protein
MAEKLQPIRLVENKKPILAMHSIAFRQGFQMGLQGLYRPNVHLPAQLTENGLVGIVRNLCELSADNELTDEPLRNDVAILVAWVFVAGGYQ